MKKRGIVLVLLTAIISGFSIFINKFGVSGMNPYVFTFLKNSVVAVLLVSIIVLAFQFKHFKKLGKKDWLNLGLIGLLGGSIPFLLFFKGLQLTSGASGAFIHKTLFVFATILALTFLKEKLNKTVIIAAVLLLIGNFLLLNLTSFSFGIGEGLILLATVFWAGEFTLSKKVLEELPSNVVAFGRMFFGSLFILAFLGITGEVSAIGSISLAQFGWVLVTSIFLLFYVLTWYGGLKHVKVSTATSILLLGSPITTLLSLVFLDAVVSFTQVLGVTFISLGVFLIVYFSEAISTAYPKWIKT